MAARKLIPYQQKVLIRVIQFPRSPTPFLFRTFSSVWRAEERSSPGAFNNAMGHHPAPDERRDWLIPSHPGTWSSVCVCVWGRVGLLAAAALLEVRHDANQRPSPATE